MTDRYDSTPAALEGEVLLPVAGYTAKAFWLDLFDRVGKTFLQNVLVFFGAGVTITSVSWPTVLGAAGLAALVSLLIGLSTATALSTGSFVIDTADRLARTFFGSLVAAIPTTGSITDIDWKASLTIAGTAALISLVTSLATANLGAAKGVPTLAPVAPLELPEHVNPTGSVDDVDGD